MPIRKSEKQIGDYTYTVATLGAFEQMDVAVDLLQLLAPAFSDVKEASLNKLLDQEVSEFLGSVAKIAASADKKKLKAVTVALARQTLVEGPGQVNQLNKVFDTHFSDDFGALIQWLGFAIGVNFLNFSEDSTSDARGALAEMMKKKATEAA